MSFAGDGNPTIFEDDGRVCFRVERYIYSHSVLSFLTRSRDVDARNIQLMDMSVGTDATDWSIKHEAAPASGMRLRKTTSICYGDAPPGFVTTHDPDPLVAGRYSILMNALGEGGELRFVGNFCLSNEGHLVDCDEGKQPPKSFLERLFRWLFGD